MSFNKVNKDTGDLSLVAGRGDTLYADLPIGSWVKNDMNTLPSFFLKEGDMISETEYPELYAKYGSTVPYKADTSELSAYESITLPTSSPTAMTMPYDGFLNISQQDSGSMKVMVYINGILVSKAGSSGYANSQSFIFRKGDVVYAEKLGSGIIEKVAYYKKSLVVKAKSIGVPANFVENVKNALQYNVPKLVATVNYAKTQNYCYRVSTTGVGVDIPFDEVESYSDGNYSARIHVMVARKAKEDLYHKTFIDIPIAKGTDPNTGLTIKSYGFIPDWSQEPTASPSSEGGYNNGIEVVLQSGTYDGVERDVIGMWYNYSIFNNSKKIVVYMPTKVGFITDSQVVTYIEKIQIFKLA